MNINCRYTNSESAEIYDVRTFIGPDSLTIYFGSQEYSWKNQECIIEEFGSDQIILINENSRLYIQIDDWKLIKDKFPQYKESLKIPWYGYAAAITIVIASYFASIPFLSEKIAEVVPDSMAQKVGEEFIESIKERECKFEYQTKVIEDKIYELVGENNFKVVVIESPQSNAFAAPGGVIVFTSRIIKDFDNEEQLMGILAHEIMHHKKRHHIKKIIKLSMTSAVWSMAISSVTGFVAFDPEIIKGFLLRSYSSADEKEADIEAIALLESKNHTARGLKEFLNNNYKGVFGNKYIEKIFSTHPATEDRIAYIDEKMTIKDQLARTTFDWVKFKEKCKK